MNIYFIKNVQIQKFLSKHVLIDETHTNKPSPVRLSTMCSLNDRFINKTFDSEKFRLPERRVNLLNDFKKIDIKKIFLQNVFRTMAKLSTKC